MSSDQSSHDFARYARQLAIPEIGKKGQEKLSQGKVLIIGCGALGSMVAMQLAGAGVGNITIADYDTIDISNLQRQFFFKTDESGKPKADILKERINALNPDIKVKILPEMITGMKAETLFGDFDFIVDATDNPESKKMTGEICKEKGKACCIAGINGFSGQVMTLLPEDPRFEDFFGQGTSEGFLPCSLGGVVGPAAALCASLQAAEVIKYLTGAGELLSGKILLFDLLNNSFKVYKLD